MMVYIALEGLLFLVGVGTGVYFTHWYYSGKLKEEDPDGNG